ncbi:DUF2971 domain-containing protein [Aeromonas dhakensis]|uniref:DUF2971 domain-containing protein n=1 Tax=Aeromonas dhakensis TaxID=196024 RepID=UPI001BD07392|nr:DUF2971 domain-containing protein [Aeromonas dhakensis]MBS4714738.1 DUF2971 domain-containing protein [Aeromonas dhakensis]BED99977.1 hypothetical protein VAWG001_15920 [Aeromonas dhakensis]
MNGIYSYFKFVSLERKDIIQNGMIRFTPIGEFNDPFELEPVITPLSRKYIAYCQSLTENELRKLELRDEDIEFSQMRVCEIKKYKNTYRENVKKYGILSLSSNFNVNPLISVSVKENKDPRRNILMWSHYSDSHRGFVIEFSRDFIQDAEIKEVNYSNERSYLTFEDIDEDNFEHVFYNKSEEWKYEQEHRLVLPLNKADDVYNEKYHLFKFDKSRILSITFGCGMSYDDKREIIELVKSDHDFRSVNFYHARLDDNEYIIDIYYDDGRFSNNPDSPFAPKYIPNQIKL